MIEYPNEKYISGEEYRRLCDLLSGFFGPTHGWEVIKAATDAAFRAVYVPVSEDLGPDAASEADARSEHGNTVGGQGFGTEER